MTLASRVHGKKSDLRKLLFDIAKSGPVQAYRLLKYTRITQRVLSRIRAGIR